MKNIFTVLILGIALGGISLAQSPSTRDTSARARTAVIEFTPGPNALGMTVEAKRQFQASIAFALVKSKRFDVVDVRWTRNESQADLAAINGNASTAAAVRVGKKLGVSYVLTGIVVEYNTMGSATLKARLVEVATGKVKYSSEMRQRSTSEMLSTGAAEMQLRVLKPYIEKLTAELTAQF